MRVCLLTILLLWISGSSIARANAAAETAVSFPLQGYYRAGKCMPVEISHPQARAPFTLRAHGAMDTTGTVENVTRVPWLIVSSSPGKPELVVGASTVPITSELRALKQNERLVGSTFTNAEIAKHLFPGSVVIDIALNPANPLPGPARAWESLDALIIERTTRLGDEVIGQLLSAGTVIVALGEPPGDLVWPWKKLENYSILRMDLAGPESAISQSAYMPTHAWRPGVPEDRLHRIVLFGLIFSLLALAASLWKSRWAVALVVLIAAGATGVFASWRGAGGTLHQAGGQIVVMDGLISQLDAWTYFTASHPATASADAAAQLRPVFADEQHQRSTAMTLKCNDRGDPESFDYRLEAGARVAFLSRQVVGGKINVRPEQPVTSPMADLARREYLTPESDIVGQISSDALWPSVVVRR